MTHYLLFFDYLCRPGGNRLYDFEKAVQYNFWKNTDSDRPVQNKKLPKPFPKPYTNTSLPARAGGAFPPKLLWLARHNIRRIKKTLPKKMADEMESSRQRRTLYDEIKRMPTSSLLGFDQSLLNFFFRSLFSKLLSAENREKQNILIHLLTRPPPKYEYCKEPR